MSGSGHKEEIVDQFTRQVAQFAQSATARNEDLLRTILRMAEPQRQETRLDLQPRQIEGQIHFFVSTAILTARIPHAA